MRISAPLKGAYAETHKLDMQELMSSGVYKENYRLDMIKWSDEIREKDPGYFCRLADNISKKNSIITFVLYYVSQRELFIKILFQQLRGPSRW